MPEYDSDMEYPKKKYHVQTYDLIICMPHYAYYEYDCYYKDAKRINFRTKQGAENLLKRLEFIFYGTSIKFRIEKAMILNTLAIRGNRQALLDSQMADLTEADYNG